MTPSEPDAPGPAVSGAGDGGPFLRRGSGSRSVWAPDLGWLRIKRAPGIWTWITPASVHLALVLLAVGITLDLTGVFTGQGWTAALSNWDSHSYLIAASGGYPPTVAAANVPGGQIAPSVVWGFFPLYPMAIAAVHGIGLGYVQAGMLVSLIAAAGLALLLYRLAILEIGSRGAAWVPWLVLFSPDGFFFSAIYTEALFFALVAGSFLAARRGRFVLAGIIGIFATATRVTGIFLVPALLLEALQQSGWRPRRLPVSTLGILLAPIGIGGFALAAGLRTGNLDAYGLAQANLLGVHLVSPWDGFLNTWSLITTGNAYFRGTFTPEVIAGLLAVPLLVIAFWKLRPMYASFMFLSWLAAISINWWNSEPRYELTFFPLAFLVVAWTRRATWVRWVLIVPAAIGMAYGASLFVRSMWLS